MEWPAALMASIPGPIWGIVGAVFGSLVANSNARRMAKDRMRHEDRTRFHDKRLELYAEFIETAYKLRSSVPRLPPEYRSGTDEVQQNMERDAATERLTNLRDSVFLLGSAEVNQVADEVVMAYWELWTAYKANDTTAQKDRYDSYETKLVKLKSVMRMELEPIV